MDKKIMTDSLACVNCPEAKRCQEQQAKKEYAINQVLQDIPTEYANVVARLKQIIPSVTRCDCVLEKRLKATLQEIKEIAKYELNNLTESAINGGRYVEILQKISEVEDGI